MSKQLPSEEEHEDELIDLIVCCFVTVANVILLLGLILRIILFIQET